MTLLKNIYRRYMVGYANNQPTEAETMRDYKRKELENSLCPTCGMDIKLYNHPQPCLVLRDRIEAAITKMHIMIDAYHNPDDVTDIKNIPTMDEIIATLEGRKL